MELKKLKKIQKIIHEWDYSTTEYNKEIFDRLTSLENDIDNILNEFDNKLNIVKE